MGANISWVPYAPTPPTDIEEDNAKILTLFENINTYRYDANAIGYSSNSLSTACNQTSDPSPNTLSAELIDYFNHNTPNNKTIKKISDEVIESGESTNDDR